MTLAVASNLVLVTTAVLFAVLVMASIAAVIAIPKRLFKLAFLVVAAAVCTAVWLQRQNLQNCVDDVVDEVRQGGAYSTCEIFGFEIEVTLPTGERP